jgi:hypothetical protein
VCEREGDLEAGGGKTEGRLVESEYMWAGEQEASTTAGGAWSWRRWRWCLPGEEAVALPIVR